MRGPALVAALCAAVATYFAVRFLLRYFETNRLTSFGYYCIGVGVMCTRDLRRSEVEAYSESSMRLLVVEDEPKLGALIVRALRAEGHAVDLCETGEDALWRAGSVAYDAIVLDVGLPGIDGFETCRRLRAGRASGRRC